MRCFCSYAYVRTIICMYRYFYFWALTYRFDLESRKKNVHFECGLIFCYFTQLAKMSIQMKIFRRKCRVFQFEICIHMSSSIPAKWNNTNWDNWRNRRVCRIFNFGLVDFVERNFAYLPNILTAFELTSKFDCSGKSVQRNQHRF